MFRIDYWGEPVPAAQRTRDPRGEMRSRRTRLVVPLAAAVLLLAGCGTVPGAAMSVNGVAISEQTVHQRTQALIEENIPADTAQTLSASTRAVFNRYQATDLVRHQLVLAAAKAEKITVTDEQVNAFIAQNGGTATVGRSLTVPAAAVPEAVYDYLVLGQLADKIPAGGAAVTDIEVTADVVPAASRDAAVAARAKFLRDPGAMDRAAADARAANPQLPGGQESLLAAPQDALFGIFTAPKGEIVLVPQSGEDYFVVRVSQRTEKPAKLTKDALSAASSLDGYMVLASLLLTKYEAHDEVMVNPRFGQWDPRTLLVVPSNSGM